MPHPPAWMFPTTYLAHLADEATFGGGFAAWFSATLGADLSLREFAWINAIGLVIVSVVAWRLTAMRTGGETVRAVLATIVLANGLLHLAASVVTRAAVPGVVTGSLLWIPLGAWSLAALVRHAPARRIATGVAIGLMVHAGVTLLALRI